MSERIEGLPEGVKLVRFGWPLAGEYYLTVDGRIKKSIAMQSNPELTTYAVVAYDNCYGKPLNELTIPEGYESTGEYRLIRNGEYFLGKNEPERVWQEFDITIFSDYQTCKRLILRKKQKKTTVVVEFELPERRK